MSVVEDAEVGQRSAGAVDPERGDEHGQRQRQRGDAGELEPLAGIEGHGASQEGQGIARLATGEKRRSARERPVGASPEPFEGAPRCAKLALP